jgi:hypothetical protein
MENWPSFYGKFKVAVELTLHLAGVNCTLINSEQGLCDLKRRDLNYAGLGILPEWMSATILLSRHPKTSFRGPLATLK